MGEELELEIGSSWRKHVEIVWLIYHPCDRSFIRVSHDGRRLLSPSLNTKLRKCSYLNAMKS